MLRLGYSLSWLGSPVTGAFLSGLLLHMAVLQLYVHGNELLSNYHQKHRQSTQFMAVVVARSPFLRLLRQVADKVLSSAVGIAVFLVLHSLGGHSHAHSHSHHAAPAAHSHH